MTIIKPIQELVTAALREKQAHVLDPNEPKISIPTRASQATFVYERMRNAIEYKEEHLVRRNAIERILRRMIAAGDREDLAENLVRELIHARYLPNDTIPQSTLPRLEQIFERYFALLGLATLKEVNDTNSLPGWTLGIMATEIDEFLVPPHIMHASINAMFEVLNKKIHLETELEHEERTKQIYIAASRALYKNDDDTIKYHLLLMYYPSWPQADHALIKEVGIELTNLRKRIQQDLEHLIREKLIAVMRKQVAYFSILEDIITHNPHDSWHDLQLGEPFNARIKKRCQTNYSAARSMLKRSVVRSIIYLVLTKFLLFIILEVPVEYVLLKRLDMIPLAINLVFPPVLLAVTALSTKLPDQKNTHEITEGINKIIHGDQSLIQVSKKSSRGFFLRMIFIISYSALFIISFGLLIYLLQFLQFSIISIAIFLFFLSLVSLFAYRIRLRSKELNVLPPKRGLIRALWGFLTIPILDAGKWMSIRFAKINVFIFVLDFVIEAPFKAFIKVTEEWVNYVHEKKEEL
jgi:hypothetical protein